jgi:tryptophan 2,3-dioxygenase
MANLNTEMLERINELQKKYTAMGQDMNSYLDGLLLSNFLSYWDYVNVDTLLTLQKPKTDFPDELIFIIYHQITELYFRLALHEYNQIAHNGRHILPTGEDKGWNETITARFLTERINRINRYFEALTKSFAIMINGMEKEQFRLFRMALLPASGFQSAQYRKIEICSTSFINLVDKTERHRFNETNSSIEDMYEFIYWKKGATEVDSGNKTLTLVQFEQRYSFEFKALALEMRDKNIWSKYLSLSTNDQNDSDLINALKQLDINVNVNWPLVHYKSAARYLQSGNEDVPATGGTNWQKYLPPRFQKRIFFPQLWSDQEKNDWGKSWVEQLVKDN